MSEEKKDFVVKDRRIFSQDAEDLQKEDETKEAAAAEQQDSDDQNGAAEESSSGEKDAEGDAQDQTASEDDPGAAQFPEINFPTFVASLNASALVHLGVIEDPATGTKSKNLPMAKQTIDILSMLEEKTTGNLSPDEKSMLQNVLYDLRIMYVKEKS